MAGLVLFAQESTSGGVAELIQYGALGLVVIGFVTGLIWAKPAVERLVADKAAAEAQRDALIATYERDVLPLLNEVAHSTTPALTAMADEVAAMRRTVEAIACLNPEEEP